MEKDKINKIGSVVLIVLFCALITLVPIANALTPNVEVSRSERRHLAVMPEFTMKNVFSSQYSTDVEEYLLDNFFIRDRARTLAASVRFGVFMQRDSGGIYIAEGSASKIESKIREGSVEKAASKLNKIREKYLDPSGCRVFIGMIPDKNYYLAEKHGYPSLDYSEMISRLRDNVAGMTYIDITGDLSAADYYTTDSHWRQERLGGVVRTIGAAMGFVSDFDEGSYEKITLEPFYGVWYGQSALPLPPDSITYLTNEELRSAVVFNYEKEVYVSIYDENNFHNIDAYDVFLHGAAALMTIENPSAASDRELILFRDSFGSSLAPLLVHEYAKITLVDIRYIVSSVLDSFIEFKGQDVLFLYSPSVLNNSDMLR